MNDLILSAITDLDCYAIRRVILNKPIDGLQITDAANVIIQHMKKDVVSTYQELTRLDSGLARNILWYDPEKPFEQQKPSEHSRDNKPQKPIAPPVVQLEPFTADQSFNAPYCNNEQLLSLLHKHRTIALKSHLGSGKTTAYIEHLRHMIQSSRQELRILVLTHLQSLTGDTQKRLNAAGIPAEIYNGLDVYKPSMGKAAVLVCSMNSAHYLRDAERYDIIVIDEFTQAIPHIFGGTMPGVKAEEAYSVLVNHLHRCGQVITIDAHMNDAAAEWLASIRGDVTRIVNTYKHQPRPLTLYADQNALIENAQTMSMNSSGTVVITTGSRRLARTLTRHFTQLYGQDDVFAVHGWNSSTKRARHFVQHINEELPKLKVFITSPSIGTGVDITAPIAGVFGIFYSEPLNAADMLQQMARYRNAASRSAYVTPSERDTLPTSKEIILKQTVKRSKRTAKFADFKSYGLQFVTIPQAHLTELYATFTAADNRQKTNIRAYFVALAQAEGFVIQWNINKAPVMRDMLKQAREQLAELDKAVMLNNPALSPYDLDNLRFDGKLDEIHFLQYARWKIENGIGQELNSELLTRYLAPQARAALRRFSSMEHFSPEYIKQLDRDNVTRLPHERAHHTAYQMLFKAAVMAVFGEAGIDSTEHITAIELTSRLQPFMETHQVDIQTYLMTRPDLSAEPIPVFRRLLRKLGVKLASKQIRQDDTRIMEYFIEHTELEILRQDAKQCAAWLEYLSKNVGKACTLQDFRQGFLASAEDGDVYQRWRAQIDTIPF